MSMKNRLDVVRLVDNRRILQSVTQTLTPPKLKKNIDEVEKENRNESDKT